MPQIGRPKVAKTLPAGSVAALLGALATDTEPRRRSDWVDRDRAIILTALLAGLRSDELIRANVGDIRRTDGGAVIHVRGKGGKDRRIPVEPPLVVVLDSYLDTRVGRFPATARRRSPAGGWAPGGSPHRCSSAPTGTESPAAPCNTGCCVPSAAPASTPSGHGVRCCTGCDTPSRPNSPTPMSACTP